MTANKPETALYRAPTFSLLLASHGGIGLWTCLLDCMQYDIVKIQMKATLISSWSYKYFHCFHRKAAMYDYNTVN